MHRGDENDMKRPEERHMPSIWSPWHNRVCLRTCRKGPVQHANAEVEDMYVRFVQMLLRNTPMSRKAAVYEIHVV